MEEVMLESQGRVLIPKKIRDELGLRCGEKMAMEIQQDKIILKPFKSLHDISSTLKGCVRESKIDHLELKKMWKM